MGKWVIVGSSSDEREYVYKWGNVHVLRINREYSINMYLWHFKNLVLQPTFEKKKKPVPAYSVKVWVRTGESHN